MLYIYNCTKCCTYSRYFRTYENRVKGFYVCVDAPAVLNYCNFELNANLNIYVSSMPRFVHVTYKIAFQLLLLLFVQFRNIYPNLNISFFVKIFGV